VQLKLKPILILVQLMKILNLKQLLMLV